MAYFTINAEIFYLPENARRKEFQSLQADVWSHLCSFWPRSKALNSEEVQWRKYNCRELKCHQVSEISGLRQDIRDSVRYPQSYQGVQKQGCQRNLRGEGSNLSCRSWSPWLCFPIIQVVVAGVSPQHSDSSQQQKLEFFDD